LTFITNALLRRPRLTAAMSALDKGRLKLPIVDLSTLFDDFNSQPVTLTDLPMGPWSSPIADVVILAKISLCLRPRRVLEVGCYRGYTTKLLAAHTLPDARIVAFDRDPRHGEAYRDSPLTAKIERRVGELSPEAFEVDPRGSYDLIFLDAHHAYASVKRDTKILLPLLAPNGIFIWHDYANWGRFTQNNGVPEFLHEFSATHPIVAIAGSWLAAHAPSWTSGAGAEQLAKACHETQLLLSGEDAWSTGILRG
jgi:SAM-dependent methyltransferase